MDTQRAEPKLVRIGKEGERRRVVRERGDAGKPQRVKAVSKYPRCWVMKGFLRARMLNI